MSWIWTVFLCLSFLCAILSGQAAALSTAALEGASNSVSLVIRLAGPLCLWSGLNRVMEECGIAQRLSVWFSPLLKRLFPQSWQDPTIRASICSNFTANLLGLGNAATPPGVRAVKEMAACAGSTATDELCRLVVMNTASIQLLPTTVAALRAGLGSSSPFDILPAVWITSACSVSAGLLAAKVLSKWI